MTPLDQPVPELMLAAMYWLHWPCAPGERPALTDRLVAAGRAAIDADVSTAYRSLACAAALADRLSAAAARLALEGAWSAASNAQLTALTFRLGVDRPAANGSGANGAKVSRQTELALEPDDPRVRAWRDRADLQ